MTQLIIIDNDGTQRTGTGYDAQMASRFDGQQALETWQVGHVQGQLAIRFKTVSSLNALLREAHDGDSLEIVYKRKLGVRETKETLTVRQAGFGIQPIVLSGDALALTDVEIVRLLDASWGEYITVTYRLVTTQGAELLPSRRRFNLFDWVNPPLAPARAIAE